MSEQKKIVLAYSGGLDTSVAIKWLQEKYQYEVIAVVVDVGEKKDLSFIKEKALKIGAKKCYVIEAVDTFANEFILPLLKANALYENQYPLFSALSRPLIAKILVEIARHENAVAIAHGCTGKGNDQVRFDVGVATLNSKLKIVAPCRESPMAREEAISYAQNHGIPLPIDLHNPYSIDQNLWGRSCECGVLEDPWTEPPESAYEWTKAIQDTPDTEEEIFLDFFQGVPQALNGEKMPVEKIISKLNILAGTHGVGRIDHVENRLVGIKSREIYEAPAAITLIKAHQALEAMTLPREVAHFKPLLEQKMASLVYEGLWYSPLRNALAAFIDETQKVVSGVIRLKLYKGNVVVTGRQSKHSLYHQKLATYKAEDEFDHTAAQGFIKLWGLPSQLFCAVNKLNESEA